MTSLDQKMYVIKKRSKSSVYVRHGLDCRNEDETLAPLLGVCSCK